MKKHLLRILEKIENAPLTFSIWLTTFLSLITIRLLVEFWLGKFQNKSGLFIFYEFTHTFLFFLVAYIIFVFLLSKFLREDFKKIANVLLYGYIIIIFPPLIDFIISQGKGFWSFYDFGSLKDLYADFFSFFDDSPEMGVTYGTKIEIAVSLTFIFIYSFLKIPSAKNHARQTSTPLIAPESNQNNDTRTQNTKRNIFKFWKIKFSNSFKISELKIFGAENFSSHLLKSLGIAGAAYFVFFILGTFPSWVTIAVDGFYKGFMNVNEIHIAQMFLTPAKFFSREIPEIISALNIKMSVIYSLLLFPLIATALYFYTREKFIAFLKNARFPQITYHLGLLIIGLALSFHFSDTDWNFNFLNIASFFLISGAIVFAWLTSIIINDLSDKNIDATSNNTRPLPQRIFTEDEYKTLGAVLFCASLLFSAIVSFGAMLFLTAYQALAWIYSAWPLRLKRFPIIATFISSIASLSILFIGFSLGSPTQSIRELPAAITTLLIISYMLSLPIKDFKDIEGDKKYSVFTIPVIFGEHWGKIIVGSGIFSSYLLSVIFLNEQKLFWWAVIFGGISFWLVSQMKKPTENRWLNYRNIFWWMQGIIILYGIILIKMIFY